MVDSVSKMDPRLNVAARYWIRRRAIATLPQWPRMNSIEGGILRTHNPAVIRKSNRKPASLTGLSPRHYPAMLASDECCLRCVHALRQAFACHIACCVNKSQSFGSWSVFHWGSQLPLNAALPLAREFEARVAVAGKPYGLSGKRKQ